MTLDPLRTIEEAAAILAVSRDTVYKLVESGRLPYVDVSSRAYVNPHKPTPTGRRPTIRFREADLHAFIVARRVAATTGELVGQPVDVEAHAQPELGKKRPPPPPGPVSQLPGADRYLN